MHAHNRFVLTAQQWRVRVTAKPLEQRRIAYYHAAVTKKKASQCLIGNIFVPRFFPVCHVIVNRYCRVQQHSDARSYVCTGSC